MGVVLKIQGSGLAPQVLVSISPLTDRASHFGIPVF